MVSSRKFCRTGVSESANSGCAASKAGRSERILGSSLKLCLGGGHDVAHSKLIPQPHGSFTFTKGALRQVLYTFHKKKSVDPPNRKAPIEETVFPKLKDEAIANLLSNHARQIFNLGSNTIQEGQKVDLTLFNRTTSITPTKAGSKSKSVNNPFLDKTLKGTVIGTYSKGQLHLNYG